MNEPLLEIKDLVKTYGRGGKAEVLAAEDVSFDVFPGECVGLVGESGSGKSTVANMVLRFVEPTSGTIRFEGADVTRAKGRKLHEFYKNVQAVFQNPVRSFDPRRTLGHGIGEGLRNRGASKHEASERVAELLERCGLPAAFAERYPHEVSGGQCQRAAIARALAMEPKLLICDEATSALDVTVQAQIVSLLEDIQEREHMALLFISHDIALVSQICERVLVMKEGQIVEQGPVADVIGSPRDAYTRELLDAVL